VKFRRHEPEVVLVVFHEVPGIGPELALHVADEAGRPVEEQVFLATEADAQEVIKADEVIHVGVGDENPVELEDRSRRQRPDVPQVEEEGFPAVPRLEQ